MGRQTEGKGQRMAWRETEGSVGRWGGGKEKGKAEENKREQQKEDNKWGNEISFCEYSKISPSCSLLFTDRAVVGWGQTIQW